MTTSSRLTSLAERPPPGVLASTWRARLIAAADFEREWGPQARALGWTDGELYALHPTAPLMRLDAMGVAFLTVGKAVVAVTADAVAFSVPPIGRIQRASKPTLAAPPAWETFGLAAS